MHRCLQILEILEETFVHFGYPESADSKALVTLARTCKRFQNPALDILRQRQETLMNLLRCLPEDALDRTATQTPRFLRSLVAADWNRPREYTHRVKEFVASHWSSSMAEILPALAEIFPSSSFLPNLVRLEWDGQDQRRVQLFCRRISPLSDWARKYHGTLKEVEIGLMLLPGGRVGATAGVKMCALVRELREVESLKIQQELDHESLVHVAKLKTMRIPSVPSLEVDALASSDVGTWFPNLQVVHIESISPSLTVHFLRRSADAPFENMSLVFYPYASPGEMELLAPTLTSCERAHPALHSLKFLNHSHVDDEPCDRRTFTSQSLRTLYCFQNLCQLHLAFWRGCDFDDEDLTNLACAWSHLTVLVLQNGTRVSEEPPRVTFHSLLALAAHCPHLESLEIDFDSRNVPSHTTEDGSSLIRQTSLKSLDVLHSAILEADVSRIADCLSTLFPNLCEIHTAAEPWLEPEEIEDALSDEEIEYCWRWRELGQNMNTAREGR
ncbi:hypothetical protein DFH09DRAFT_1286808 [Mycena vulgaris]|nr:hypothetical protein DFH09DRAFT_1286808 [Mycena vulgaris]